MGSAAFQALESKVGTYRMLQMVLVNFTDHLGFSIFFASWPLRCGFCWEPAVRSFGATMGVAILGLALAPANHSIFSMMCDGM